MIEAREAEIRGEAIVQETLPVEVILYERPAALPLKHITAREKDAWSVFLGKDIVIPEPPGLLYTAVVRLQEKGWTSFTPVYFPPIKFQQNDMYAGWHTKPNEWFWHHTAQQSNKDKATLTGYWALADLTEQSVVEGNEIVLPPDPLGALLDELREKVPVVGIAQDVPLRARVGIPRQVQDVYLFPRLARELGLVPAVREDTVRIERPTAMEFNVLANRYPFLGQSTTAELLQDTMDLPGSDYHVRDISVLIGGDVRQGGAAHIGILPQALDKRTIGFRPVIKFVKGD